MLPGWPRRFGGTASASDASPPHSVRSPTSCASLSRDTSPSASLASSAVASAADATYTARALYDFTPVDPVEVAIRSGDVVSVFSAVKTADGWLYVANRSQSGLVPASYVTRISDDADRSSAGGGSASARRAGRSGSGKLLIDSTPRLRRDELASMSSEKAEAELQVLEAQMEKDMATLKLRYARRKAAVVEANERASEHGSDAGSERGSRSSRQR